MVRFGVIVTVLAAMAPCACFAAKLDHAEELPTIVLYDMVTAAGEAALPEAPEVAAVTFSAETPARVAEAAPRLSLSRPEFSPVVSPIYSMPLVTVAMRMGGRKFNTDDGSSMDGFAICYRLNRRSSVQVIPGDPAPVKLPVATMANNMGVTVGMVYRLSKRP